MSKENIIKRYEEFEKKRQAWWGWEDGYGHEDGRDFFEWCYEEVDLLLNNLINEVTE